MSLGSQLRTLRRQKRLTLKTLASELGVSLVFLSQVERNRVVPSPERVRQLASALGADVDHLNLLAGRVPPVVLHNLRQNPNLFDQLRLVA